MELENRKVQTAVDSGEHREFSRQAIMERFRRRPFEGFDRRFFSILLVSFVLHFSVAMYFVMNPPPEEFSQEEIEKIQKRFVRLVLDRELPKEEETKKELEGAGRGAAVAQKPEKPEETAGEGAEQGGRKRGGPVSAEARAAARRQAAAARRQTRAQIAKEASGAGVLALLTAQGSSGSGADAVDDVLDQVGGLGGDLDVKLTEVGGLKTSGKPGDGSGYGEGSGRGVRGGRTTSAAGIDDLVSGLSAAEAASLTRSGDLIVSSASPVDDGLGGTKGSRDPDAVSAVVNSHNSAIQYCYQRALRRNPDLKGKLVVRFVITPAGTVKNVEVVDTTLTDESVISCVLSRIRRWNDFGAIDPSKGHATFRQVYAFGY